MNAVRLIVSATTSNGSPRTASRACFTTPGPDTPTEIALSPSVTPKKAPAINGLSSTGLQKITSLAQPSASLSLVRSAVFLTIMPISRTASMLIPVLVEPTPTELHTISVVANASGMELIRMRSDLVAPFVTSAEKPPIKLTPTVFAARSSASAIGT